MSDLISTEKPSLVSTGQGFSILNTVQYKNRFLYSKYSPDKAVLVTVEKATILAGSLVVVCAPCLWYGTEELLRKLPSNCAILAVESDEGLVELEEAALVELRKRLTPQENSLLHFMPIVPEHPQDSSPQAAQPVTQAAQSITRARLYQKLESFIQTHGGHGSFKRAIRLDFSAGVSFNPSFYQNFADTAENLISQFWKNRLTLVKLGRLYARNIFKNLSSVPKAHVLSQQVQTIEKPIIVCGAGESLECLLKDKTLKQQILQKKCLLLAADAALPSLVKSGILPDGVVGVESQLAIEKAYLGSRNTKITLYADITSRPQIKDILQGDVVWFASKYADAEYLKELYSNGIIQTFIPPLGSVGLVATYIALLLRKDTSIPVYTVGLDFSFSCGATHAKGTPAHLARLLSSSRFSPVENYAACFREGAFETCSKEGKSVYTDSIMTSYAENFKAQFAGTKNLFNLGTSGLDLGIEQASKIDESFLIKETSGIIKQSEEYKAGTKFGADEEIRNSLTAKTAFFYEKEKNVLTAIKDLLSNGNISLYRDPSVTLQEQLVLLLKKRDYLYLHFPDGYNFSTDISFLKRIRAEIDFFLKDIDFATRK